MGETSARLGLPFLAVGQAQKELTHNEALALIDLALHAGVEAVGTNVPPAAPVEGQAWIVGSAPSGAWTGRSQALAGWTPGGWRLRSRARRHGGAGARERADSAFHRRRLDGG
jgi:hypothetical protein